MTVLINMFLYIHARPDELTMLNLSFKECINQFYVQDVKLKSLVHVFWSPLCRILDHRKGRLHFDIPVLDKYFFKHTCKNTAPFMEFLLYKMTMLYLLKFLILEWAVDFSFVVYCKNKVWLRTGYFERQKQSDCLVLFNRMSFAIIYMYMYVRPPWSSSKQTKQK